MRLPAMTFAMSCTVLLSACTTVTPAFKDIGTRNSPCVEGGPDSVAQQFYDFQIANPHQIASNINALRPYLSDDLFAQLIKARTGSEKKSVLQRDMFSRSAIQPTQAKVASASTIPNTDARNIPLRVELMQGDKQWKDEVLMIREGQCWVLDDVRYVDGSTPTSAGTLRQSIESDDIS